MKPIQININTKCVSNYKSNNKHNLKLNINFTLIKSIE